MQAPEWFVRELKAFDPDLRVRWSARLEMFQLERRVRRGLHPGTILNDGWHDSYIRAQDGYVLVASIPVHGLTRSVFQKLRESDLWANGGWKKVADDLDAADEAFERQAWQSIADDIKARSAAVYDFLAHREGRSIYNAGWMQ